MCQDPCIRICVRRTSAREPDEQVFSAGLDAFDRAAAERCVGIDARQRRKDRLESRDRAARQRALQRAGRPEDCVALRH